MSKQFLKGALILFILLNVFFTAPLRYFFTFILGQNILNYSINLVFGILIVTRLSRNFSTLFTKNLLIILYVALLVAYSLIFENSKQLGFFFYLLQPCIFYGLYNKEVKEFIQQHYLLFVALFVISVLGISYDYFYDYPWKSLNYTIGDTEISLSRDWTSFDTERIAGLTRSSFDAAMTMMILLIILLSKVKNIFIAHILFAVTLGCIWVTTTKGCITSLLLLYVVYMVEKMMSKTWKKILINGLVSILFFLVIIIPLGIIKNIEVPGLNNESLVDRIQNSWPFIMGQFTHLYHYILGLGLGSVGTAQFIFRSEDAPNLGDNLFLYLYCNFGLLAFFLFFHLFLRFKSTNDKLFIYILLFTLSYGLTTNIFESSVGLIMISICFFYPLQASGEKTPDLSLPGNWQSLRVQS